MPRLYTKQRKRFDCGPVTIINALKWAGKNITYEKRINYFKRLCKCDDIDGTKHRNFDRALRISGKDMFSIRRVHHPTLKEIVNHLKNKNAIVINYRWRKRKSNRNMRHFILLVGIEPSKDSFDVVNGYGKGPALQPVLREQFKRLELRFQRVDKHYNAWFLTKLKGGK